MIIDYYHFYEEYTESNHIRIANGTVRATSIYQTLISERGEYFEDICCDVFPRALPFMYVNHYLKPSNKEYDDDC